jgi:hypothetical protein
VLKVVGFAKKSLKTRTSVTRLVSSVGSLVPASSADVERLFSGAFITFTKRRNKLNYETLEALEYLKSYMELEK